MPATKKKANEAQFYFFAGSSPSDAFEVMNFSGVDAISAPFAFTILLLSHTDNISPDDMVNKQASLYMYRDEEYYPYSGIVSEFQFVDRNTDYCTYSVKLVPKLWLLNLNVQTRVFQKKNVPTIIKDVFAAANMAQYYTMDVDTSKYPEREYVVQYQESDLNFISRLMEENGIWYFFTESPLLAEELEGTPGSETLKITDKPANFEFVSTTSDIIFRSTSGLNENTNVDAKESIHRLQQGKHVIPTEVSLKNYNYRTPEVDISSRKPLSTGNIGKIAEFGGSPKNTSEADRLATVASGRILSRQVAFDGAGNCRGFRAGSRYTLQEHFRTDFNAVYVVTQVTHAGAHTSTDQGANMFTYNNSFRCIPSAQADVFRPERKAVVPRINGVMTAMIEANGSSYAALDDQGRYKVRMPFDTSGAANYGASKYMRLAQPYSGSNYGIHFPSHEGTEMVFGCIDGDPSKPMGLGTIPNANTISPVVSQNKEQSVIRTAGGNEIVLDDTDTKQKLRMTTYAANKVEFDDENKKIQITTTDLNSLLLDDQNKKVMWNAGDHSITMDYDTNFIVVTTKNGNIIKLDDDNERITVDTKAGHHIEMDDGSKSITLKDCAGKNTVTLDGNGGLILDSQGKIEIKAQQDLVITAANIKMTANSAIEAKATSDLKLKGMNIEAKADMNAKVEGGMNLDLKAGMQCNVKGMMLALAGDTTAELKGGAMTTVKGGIVMIN